MGNFALACSYIQAYIYILILLTSNPTFKGLCFNTVIFIITLVIALGIIHIINYIAIKLMNTLIIKH